MDLECHRDSLSAENQKQLAEYDTDVYLEAECVSDVIPNGCNIFGLGQECRSCFASCRGALLYVEDYAAEIAEKVRVCVSSRSLSLHTRTRDAVVWLASWVAKQNQLIWWHEDKRHTSKTHRRPPHLVPKRSRYRPHRWCALCRLSTHLFLYIARSAEIASLNMDGYYRVLPSSFVASDFASSNSMPLLRQMNGCVSYPVCPRRSARPLCAGV